MSAALCHSVSRLLIHMETGQAIGAVISMVTAGAAWNHLPPTGFTNENLIAGMISIISFLKCFSFILAIQLSALLILFLI
jgi:hypothetical protein